MSHILHGDRSRGQWALVDVLRQLDHHALGHLFSTTPAGAGSQLRGARLACQALRDFVDRNLQSVRLRLSHTLLATRHLRPQQPSPLARLRTCHSLTIRFDDEDDEDDEDEAEPASAAGDGAEEQQQQEQQQQQQQQADATREELAALCVAGVESGVLQNIRSLRLECGAMGLRGLARCAAALRLPNVRVLELSTERNAADLMTQQQQQQQQQQAAAHAALRAALPRLERLQLPQISFLAGIEAFSGSGLVTVDASRGLLTCSHVCSLQQLQQLRELRLLVFASDAEIVGAAEAAAAAGGDLAPGQVDDVAGGGGGVAGEPDDEATLAGLCSGERGQLWALRLLLASPPPALQSLKMQAVFVLRPGMERDPALDMDLRHCEMVTRFAGSTVSSIGVRVVYGLAASDYLAAALLPRLAAAGQRRLPEARLQDLCDSAASIATHLRPHRPLARLLALCDTVQLRTLMVAGVFGAANTDALAGPPLAAALRAVCAHLGRPEDIMCCGDRWNLVLRPVRRGAAAAAAAAFMATLSASCVLQWAADLVWDLGTPAAAAAAALMSSGAGRQQLVMLRGPLIRELAASASASGRGGGGGADGDGDGNGGGGGAAAALRAWLDGLMQQPLLGRADAGAGSSAAEASRTVAGDGAAAAAATERVQQVVIAGRVTSCVASHAAAAAVVACDSAAAATHLIARAAALAPDAKTGAPAVVGPVAAAAAGEQVAASPGLATHGGGVESRLLVQELDGRQLWRDSISMVLMKTRWLGLVGSSDAGTAATKALALAQEHSLHRPSAAGPPAGACSGARPPGAGAGAAACSADAGADAADVEAIVRLVQLSDEARRGLVVC